MLQRLKRILPNEIKSRLRHWIIGHHVHTYYFSQGGEDQILQAIISDLLHQDISAAKGFYVDIGAYAPVLHSNTYLFYINGWSGINVDPRPGFKATFDRVRPRDINVEAGIARESGELPFYVIGEDSTMNTFSKEHLEELGMIPYIQRTVPVKTMPLSALLDQHLPPGKIIDLLNIDAEGMDLDVLQSNNWAKYRPKVICAELGPVLDLGDIGRHKTISFLEGQGYVAVAKNYITQSISSVIFIDRNLVH